MVKIVALYILNLVTLLLGIDRLKMEVKQTVSFMYSVLYI